MYPSAGTDSPAPSSTVSPTTTSAAGISVMSPARRTRQTARPASAERRRYAASPPHADTVETIVAVSTDTAMPMVSNQSVCRNVNMIFAASAQSSTFMTGSPRFAAKREKKPRCRRSVRRLSPCSARERSTSAADRPGEGPGGTVTPRPVMRGWVVVFAM